MAKSRVTRRQLLIGAAPAVAAVPLVKLALPGTEAAAADAFGWRTGWGTVTMLRLYDLTVPGKPGELWADRPLELRVSF